MNQRARVSSHDHDNGIYIAYVVWRPLDEMSDEELELGLGWVLKDTDEFIRPRPEDLTPDPAKFRPLLVAPEDPYYYLYTDTERFDSKTEDGTEMADVFKGVAGVDDATINPDGSIKLSLNGRKVTTTTLEFPNDGEPILGIDPCAAVMFSANRVRGSEAVLQLFSTCWICSNRKCTLERHLLGLKWKRNQPVAKCSSLLTA